MYANNWLKSPRAFPITTIPGDDYPSGGPTINMMAVWKVAAPSLDLLAPDIYVPSSERYRAVMQEFHRPDNPLLIPESLGFEPFPGASGYARYLYYALGEGAIGFANFGLDRIHVDGTMNAETASQVEGFRLARLLRPRAGSAGLCGQGEDGRRGTRHLAEGAGLRRTGAQSSRSRLPTIRPPLLSQLRQTPRPEGGPRRGRVAGRE